MVLRRTPFLTVAITLPLAEDINEKVFSWVDEYGNHKFFMLIWVIDTHDPYDPPAPFDRQFADDYEGPIDGSRESLRLVRKQQVRKEDVQHIVDLYDGEISYLDAQFGHFVKMLKEKYGEEGIKLACEVMRFLGRKYAEEKVKELNITPGKADVLDFYKIEGGWDPSMEYKFKLLELNKKKFHIYYTACPLVDIWKSIGAPEEICQIYAYFDVGVAEVLNPKMKVSNPTSLYKGDDHCDFIVELED